MTVDDRTSALPRGMRVRAAFGLCIAVSILGAYLYHERAALDSLPSPRTLPIVACVGATLAYLFAGAATTFHAGRRFAKNMTLGECVALGAAAGVAGMFMPSQLVTGARAVVVKRQRHFDYAEFAGSIAGTTMITVVVYGATACGFALATLVATAWLAWLLALGTALVVASAVSLIKVPHTPLQRGPVILRRVVASWQILGADRPLIRSMAAWTFFNLVMQNLATATGCWALGADVGFMEFMLAGTFAGLAGMIGFTPGAIGVYEAIVSGMLAGKGVDPTLIVAGTLLSRVVLGGVLMASAPFAAHYLRERFSKAEEGRVDEAA